MSKKRVTKAQREAKELEALTQRLTDIYSGAFGSAWSDASMCFCGAEQLSRIHPAVEECFCYQVDTTFIWETCHLDKWETPETLATYLFSFGIRA